MGDHQMAFRSILVDIDATVPTHPALERAIRLARRSGARLTITDILTIPAYARRSLPAELEEEVISGRRQQLTRIADAVTGVRTEAKLLIGRPGTVLVQEVLRSNHDLLMRSHARDTTSIGPRPFGAVDMELLRRCPCPVFLVRHGHVDPHPQIVAAVNASTEEAAERALNVKIVELALLIAEHEGGVPILLQAWTPFAELLVRSHGADADVAAYVEDVRQRTAADLRQLAQSFGDRLVGVQLVHRRGEPEAAISEFVVGHGVDLVVMGTVARGGIAGLLIGNTTERVLRQLPCSVLAVKPEGFVCPVKLDDGGAT
ncbi:MAG: universal stress protein [Acidobacteria bacterium]|nr:universal stress protein [Acidobacteriota bacterium]